MRRVFGLCAGAALSVAVSAIGCGGSYQAPPEPGGAKGPEMKTAASTGQPISGSASSMAQRPPPFVAPPTPRMGATAPPTSVDAGTD